MLFKKGVNVHCKIKKYIFEKIQGKVVKGFIVNLTLKWTDVFHGKPGFVQHTLQVIRFCGVTAPFIAFELFTTDSNANDAYPSFISYANKCCLEEIQLVSFPPLWKKSALHLLSKFILVFLMVSLYVWFFEFTFESVIISQWFPS